MAVVSRRYPGQITKAGGSTLALPPVDLQN